MIYLNEEGHLAFIYSASTKQEPTFTGVWFFWENLPSEFETVQIESAGHDYIFITYELLNNVVSTWTYDGGHEIDYPATMAAIKG